MSDLIVTDAADADSSQRTKDRLLLLLKTRGGMTTKALATALGISVPAVRTHLKSLAGSVQPEDRVSGVGRPAQVFENAADMGGVVLHAKLALDDFANPRTGP